MPLSDGTPAKAGLGTSIVQALARQLGGAVTVIDAHPGTRIAVAGRLNGSGDHSIGPAMAV
jgi:two-component sensor histidine kinase